MSERIGAERTLAAYEQASAGRETWRIKALEMEADRDRWEARASAVAAAYDELHDTAGQYNAAVNVLARDNTRLEDERDALAAQVAALEPFAGIWRDVQTVLDRALGTEASDGAGEGTAADVALVVKQRDRLAAQVERVRALHLDDAGECNVCSDDRGPKPWPCATLVAVGGPAESTPDGAE